MGEFDVIARYFQRTAPQGEAVALGIGDDCALLTPRAGTQLAVSSDMLVEGRHFLSTVSPEALGHKALAVNLSDLAACGAQPLAFTLALSMPRVDEVWLAGFSKGLFALADAHGCALVGGDTTQGPLNICITVFGEIPVAGGKSQALLRSGARVGDDIYVSGTATDCVGDARLALEAFRGSISLDEKTFAHARARMERPTPRVALGMALRGVASSAIDVSDGLLGDLGHILQRSGVGATVAIDLIATNVHATGTMGTLSTEFRRTMRATGGDDYELVFTAPTSGRMAVQSIAASTQTVLTRMGSIEAQAGLRLVDAQGHSLAHDFASFDHFKT
ncbi:MAG: thiamine-phosphate kinase [Burkholderiaceae bacterium]